MSIQVVLNALYKCGKWRKTFWAHTVNKKKYLKFLNKDSLKYLYIFDITIFVFIISKHLMLIGTFIFLFYPRTLLWNFETYLWLTLYMHVYVYKMSGNSYNNNRIQCRADVKVLYHFANFAIIYKKLIIENRQISMYSSYRQM